MTTDHAPTSILYETSDLKRLILWIATMAARHPEWRLLRQQFLATFNEERLAIQSEHRITERNPR